MQGLFGRLGKKKPEPVGSRPNSQMNEPQSSAEIDVEEFPIARRFDPDEETNWDDAETIENENSPIVDPQPFAQCTDSAIGPVATSTSTTPDVDNWDEALPAATVKDSNVQQVRGKNRVPAQPSEDVWDDNLPNSTFSIGGNPPPQSVSPDRMGRAIGIWTATIQQLRRILPAPLRQLSDAILTAIVIALVTISIWVVDSFTLPGIAPSAVSKPSLPTMTAISPNPVINPEQAFIDAIQAQLNDVTSQYPDDLIQTLQVDFTSERLIVRLNPIWYSLDDQQQNNLTDRMWLQARANHFTKLEVQDAQGNSIARSPVVGQHLIILQRR
jgi:hypothetical protein